MIPTRIILHCSDTADGPGYSGDAIRRYHVQTLGWKDVGYHVLLERVAGRLVLSRGRPPHVEGAHCAAGGANHDALGLCVVGRFDDTPPSSDVYAATVMALATLAFLFGVPPSAILGHRELESAKTCPGLAWDLDRVRADVGALLAREPLVSAPHLVL